MKVQNPIIGRAKGSAGGMTFTKVYDKNVARAKAFEVSNPKTPAQQVQRAFFAELTAVCTDFSDELLRTLFPMKPKTMSRRNAITKQIAESNTMSNGAKVIDYSDIDTLGNASVMDFGSTACQIVDDEIITELEGSVSNNPLFSQNYFFAAIVNETKKQISVPAQFELVSEGRITVVIPSTWEITDTVHAIPFITNATSAEQVAGGFGTMGVTKRPARKD